jgi:prevent-host-death family protein
MNSGLNDPISVTAGEISRNFGQWQDRALHAPVIVTNHGRPRVVVISADLYTTLSEGETDRDAGPDGDIGRSAILFNSTEGFLALDHDLRVVETNGAFEALLGLNAERLKGQSWDQVFPGAAQSIIGEQFKRVLRAGDMVEFEASATPNGARRCTMRAFPYPGGLAVIIVNRTEERDLKRRLDETLAFQKALSSLHGVATARLNVRGVIVEVDNHFAGLTGFKSSELLDVRLTDVARPSERRALGDAIEQVLQGAAPRVLPATLLVKNGEERAIELGVAAIIRDGMPEGLVAAVQPRSFAPEAAPGPRSAPRSTSAG